MDSRDSEDMAISSFVIVLKLFNVCSNLRRIGHFVRKLQCNPLFVCHISFAVRITMGSVFSCDSNFRLPPFEYHDRFVEI